VADLTDLVLDDQFLLNGLLCGAETAYPSGPDGDGFDFFPAAEVRQNDKELPTGGILPGNDSFGGLLVTLDGEFYVEHPTTVMDLRRDLAAAFRPGNLTVPFDLMHQGMIWTYFGRPRGLKATPATGAWPWAAEFMVPDSLLYGPELGPFDVDGDGLTLADGGSVPSPRWRVEVVGPCTNPVIGYPTTLADGTTVMIPITYTLVVPSGSTFVVTGRQQDVARAYVDDGAGHLTSVMGYGRDPDGNFGLLLPAPPVHREFLFLSTSGTDTASVTIRDAQV
jgi:hypothetical protein